MRYLLIVALFLSFQLTGCGGKKSGEAGASDSTQVKEAVAVDLMVDPAGSKLEWTGSKLGGKSHNGTISLKSGNLTVKGADLIGGKFVIDMKSISVLDLTKKEEKEALEMHLKGQDKDNDKKPDFFRVDSFPEATFEITGATAQKTDSTSHVINGNLTLNGKTKPVSFPAMVMMPDSNSVNASGTITVNRTDFDIKFMSKSDDNWFKTIAGKGEAAVKDAVISDEFKLKVSIAAKK
jgi:polyisoprenoid-binding protein YceI